MIHGSAIHLDEWLYNLSDDDYKACARGHRAVGTNGGAQFAGMVNVESMAGALLIQHYRTELLQPDHVLLFSAASHLIAVDIVAAVKAAMEVAELRAGKLEAVALQAVGLDVAAEIDFHIAPWWHSPRGWLS